MKLIQNGFADFAPFEPEDMYISAKFMDDTLAVFLEMRDVLTQLGNFIDHHNSSAWNNNSSCVT